MRRNQSSQSSDTSGSINKILLSAFVIGAFSVYTAYERFSQPDLSGNSGTAGGVASQAQNGQLSGNVKDGTYIGSEVDAYYGLVKVQTTVRAGKITDVQFLEFPKDRRTSQRINSIAMPYLQQEAIQAQTANVDIVSGATLTSQAFQMSLQAALNSATAKN